MNLKKSGQPEIWIEIYHRLTSINERQNKIKPLPDNIKTAMNFKELNLDNEISNSKEKAELYICAKVNLLLKNINEENIALPLRICYVRHIDPHQYVQVLCCNLLC
jgi:hypothetical protein